MHYMFWKFNNQKKKLQTQFLWALELSVLQIQGCVKATTPFMVFSITCVIVSFILF